MRSREKREPSANSPKAGYEIESGQCRTDYYSDNVSPNNPLRMRCLAMGPHEYDECAGGNGDDNRGAEDHVDDQEDHQQRQRGESTLEEVILPVPPELSIDQPSFQ